MHDLDEGQIISPLTEEDVVALAGAGDDIPTVVSFEANPQRNGQSIQIGYHVEATDDMAVNRLEFHVENILTGETSTRTMLCFDEPSCVVDDVYPFASEGNWLISVFAVDTSGQASGVQVLPVVILGHEEFAPAFVVGDIVDAAGLGEIELWEENDDADFVQADQRLQIGNAITVEQGCFHGLVDPRENGNFVSLTYLCEEVQAPPNYHLSWRFRVEPRPGIVPIEEIYTQENQDMVLLIPDQNFAFLHEDRLCGIRSAYYMDVHWTDQNGSIVPVGQVIVDGVPSEPCAADGLVRDMRVLEIDEKVQVSWNFAQASGVTDAVNYALYREDLNVELPARVETGTLEAGALLAGDVPRVAVDTLGSCGVHQYRYYLVASYGSVSQKILAHADYSQPACQGGALANVGMDLSPGYTEIENSSYLIPGMLVPTVAISSFIPPMPSLAGQADLSLRLTAVENQLHNNFAGNPLQIPVTADIIANGLNYEGLFQVECGALPVSIAWELVSNNTVIDASPVFSVLSSPCLPRPEDSPQITNLYGSSADCIGYSYSACAVLQWEPWQPQAADNPAVQLRATGFVIIRVPVFANGNFGALGANPNDFLAERVWYPGNDASELISRMPCIPPNTALTYMFAIVPTYYVPELRASIYGKYAFHEGYLDACQSLPYDEVGTIY
ncbi:MAG: hypothetical protein Kow002_10440 [Anaerolineales bacterium]